MILEDKNKENYLSDLNNQGKLSKILCNKTNREKEFNKNSNDSNINCSDLDNNPFSGINNLKKSKSNKIDEANNNSSACNCKNSQCLKLYCECFSSLKYCNPNLCSCKGCSNGLQNESLRYLTIQNYYKKNPFSFKNLLTSSEKKFTFGKGCTCKKSFCLKKYCECYHNNSKCGNFCKCIECKNSSKEDEYIKNSDSSTRTSSFSNTTELNFNKKFAPCLVIINEYKINHKYLEANEDL